MLRLSIKSLFNVKIIVIISLISQFRIIQSRNFIYEGVSNNNNLDDDEIMHPELPTRFTRNRMKRDLPHLTFDPIPSEIDQNYWIHGAQETIKDHLKTEKLNKNLAKNVIYFLGDGMSIATQTAARIYKGGENLELSFEKFPYTGLSKTYCTNTQVADSACSATAYLSGIKANYGTVGLNSNVVQSDCNGQHNESNHIDSIFKWAQDAGFNTGFITTTHVTHASPAGIYAHCANRYWENDGRIKRDGYDPIKCPDIAHQLIHNDVGKKLNIVMGGGREQLLPTTQIDCQNNPGRRIDGVNLIEKWKFFHQDRSSYVENRDQLLNVSKETEFLFGVFNTQHLPFHLDANLKEIPTLVEMLEKALEIFQSQNKRYFLFVEGGRIDHAHHNTLARKSLDETLEFEKAVDYARRNTNESDTLIVSTSDHSHTLSFSGYASREHDILGLNDAELGLDGKPYTTLGYANGPTFYKNMDDNGIRLDLKDANLLDKDYGYPSNYPLNLETHGGDDVAVYAVGPYAHLFTGNYEQNFIPHAIAYAACIGKGLVACDNN